MTLLMVILAGALQAACLAWPMPAPQALAVIGLMPGQPLWWGQLLALALLVVVLEGCATWRAAAWRGWLFSLAWLACTFGWLFTSMHTFGGLPAPLAVLAVLILAGLLAIYHACACAAYWALSPVNRAYAAIIFGALWLLAELGRGLLLTGFGWGAIGYAQLDGPLQPLIVWLGSYGVGAVAAALAVLVASVWRSSSWHIAVRRGLLVLACLWLPQFVSAPHGGSAGSLNVTLLQGNIDQNEKFEPLTGVPKALRWYGDQLQANRSSLLITPETAVPVLRDQLPVGYWDALQQRFVTGQQAALVGMPMGNDSDGYTNSVVGLAPGQTQPWRYNKHHLVPFGEYIPPFFRWFTKLMHIPLGDFSAGELPQPTFDWQGQRLAVTICYENLFGEELASGFTDAALAPTMLVNVSNLGWFGQSLAMNQHLQIARMRSLELGRPFLLATNTGQTAIVNHLGQVTHALAPHTAAALQAQVEGRTGLTPYARWASRFGPWPLWALGIAVVLLGIFRFRHQDFHSVIQTHQLQSVVV